jgi:hypothetical protein
MHDTPTLWPLLKPYWTYALLLLLVPLAWLWLWQPLMKRMLASPSAAVSPRTETEGASPTALTDIVKRQKTILELGYGHEVKPGQRWAWIGDKEKPDGSPWPRPPVDMDPDIRILEVKAGWVRYLWPGLEKEERNKLDWFLANWRYVDDGTPSQTPLTTSGSNVVSLTTGRLPILPMSNVTVPRSGEQWQYNAFWRQRTPCRHATDEAACNMRLSWVHRLLNDPPDALAFPVTIDEVANDDVFYRVHTGASRVLSREDFRVFFRPHNDGVPSRAEQVIGRPVTAEDLALARQIPGQEEALRKELTDDPQSLGYAKTTTGAITLSHNVLTGAFDPYARFPHIGERWQYMPLDSLEGQAACAYASAADAPTTVCDKKSRELLLRSWHNTALDTITIVEVTGSHVTVKDPEGTHWVIWHMDFLYLFRRAAQGQATDDNKRDITKVRGKPLP